jgi:very-short-patch-repair endonuclease
MVHAPPPIRSHAREMRKEPTRSEDRIWSWLRNRRFGNYKFRRQHPLGDYILDFYCAELKICIELDGAVHEIDAVAERDKERTRYLERQGIEVLRLENEELIRDPDTVIDCVQWAINKCK